MMSRPARLCSACGGVHPVTVLCPPQIASQRERKARHDLRRPSATTRGYDAEWRRLSKQFLARPENHYCECGAIATLVRHRISIRLRPDLRLVKSNWQPGCARCNAHDAASERQNSVAT